jgi:hypothetical protein
VPKLGAVQRWVRECDAKGGDALALRVLDGILRTAAPEQVGSTDRQHARVALSQADVGSSLRGACVYHYPEWTDTITTSTNTSTTSTAAHTTASFTPEYYREHLGVLKHIDAAQRRPPNKHGMDIFTNAPQTIRMDDGSRPACTRVDVPFVPGAFFLRDLLSVREATQIRDAAEAIGYTHFQPGRIIFLWRE